MPRGSSALAAAVRGLGDERPDLLDELAHVLELPVHRGEPDVRHVVHREQLRHHPLPDPDRGDLLLRGRLELHLEGVDEMFDGGVADGALLARLEDAGEDLLPVERLAAAVPLDHQGELLLDPLVGGETALAGEAFPPSPDHVAVLTRPGVDHLVVVVAAPGAPHGAESPTRTSSIPTSESISCVRASLYPSM